MRITSISIIAFLFLVATSLCHAQFGMPSEVYQTVFGAHTNFSADVVLNRVLKTNLTDVQFHYSRLDEKSREDFDYSSHTNKILANIKPSKPSASDIALETAEFGLIGLVSEFFDQDYGAKKASNALARVIGITGKYSFIHRPDLSSQYTVYPGIQSYIETTLTNKLTLGKNPSRNKILVNDAGKETVDGHDCLKKLFILTSPSGISRVYTAWLAVDMDNFPVKINLIRNSIDTTYTFRNVLFTETDTALFEIPKGYTKRDKAGVKKTLKGLIDKISRE